MDNWEKEFRQDLENRGFDRSECDMITSLVYDIIKPTEQLNVHNVNIFLTGWGINKTKDLSEALVERFGAKPIELKLPEKENLNDPNISPDIWNHMAGWNAYADELIRLNPNLVKGVK